VVWLLRGRTAPSAVYGAVSFVALVLGYAAVSELRDGRRAALGAGLLAGIALGDCAYGLLVVSATTGWFYRPLIGLLGVAVLVVTLALRSRRAATVVLVAVAVAGGFSSRTTRWAPSDTAAPTRHGTAGVLHLPR